MFACLAHSGQYWVLPNLRALAPDLVPGTQGGAQLLFVELNHTLSGKDKNGKAGDFPRLSHRRGEPNKTCFWTVCLLRW